MSDRKKRCIHMTVQYDWGMDSGVQIRIRKWCFGCGTTLSLGPSNDGTPEVKLEIRAAQVEANERLRLGKRWRKAEKRGWMDCLQGHAPEVDHRHQAGWLARQIFNRHEDHDPADIEQPAPVAAPAAETVLDLPAPEPLPQVLVETDLLDGTDQGDPEPPPDAELVEIGGES